MKFFSFYFSSLFWLVFLLVPTANLSAQNTTEQKISSILSDPMLKGASMGISAIDIHSGKIVTAFDQDRILIPASTFKLLSTSAALEYLGADFKFKTELMIKGKVVNGQLRGDVIIRGYGDPTLGSGAFDENPTLTEIQKIWLAAIKGKGITSVTGHVIVDGSYFALAPEQPTWSWMDLGNYYASGAWGLNISDNLYKVSFSQRTQLQEIPPIIKIEPEVPGLILVNEIVTAGAGTGDNAYFYGGPFQTQRYIRGTIPAGRGVFTIKGSLPDPEKFMAFHMHRTLIENGIHVQGNALTHRESNNWSDSESTETVLSVLQSPPLSRMVEVANKESNNLICEALLKQLAIQLKGGKYLYQGPDVIREWMAKMSVPDESYFIEDGSGLSSRNGISPEAMTTLLSALRKKSYFPVLEKSLAQAGKEGTLKNTFSGLHHKSRFLAKSGSLGRVRCYAGYLKTQSGRELAVTIMFNQFTCSSAEARKKIEAIVYELALL